MNLCLKIILLLIIIYIIATEKINKLVIYLTLFVSTYLMFGCKRNNRRDNIKGGGKSSKNLGLPYDFVYQKYSKDIDDQQNLKISYDEQLYLHKDYASNIEYAFQKFTEDSDIPPKYSGNTIEEINKIIKDEILNGQDKYWTNKRLSYMRKDIQGKRIMRCIYEPLIKKVTTLPVNVVDATANIGGTTLLFAMQKWVKYVKSYDRDPEAIRMLRNNVDLYGYNEKVTIIDRRFDYDIPENAVVCVDPPFETPNNPDNFNLSIEPAPIYYVVEDMLAAGASIVFLNMPAEFRYNAEFADDHHQYVNVYVIPTKKIKIFAISKKNIGKYKKKQLVKDTSSGDIYGCKLIPASDGDAHKFYKHKSH